MRYHLKVFVFTTTLALSGCCENFDRQIALDDFYSEFPRAEEISVVQDYACSGTEIGCSCWYVEICYKMPEWKEAKDTTIQYWSPDKGKTWINRTEYLKENNKAHTANTE